MLVCVTGEIGSGKSTALKIIKSCGYCTFEMDDYIHHIYKKNNIGYQLIKQHFGSDYVSQVAVNRKKLGKLVFSNPAELKKLNKLMIPLMQEKLAKKSEKSTLLFVAMGIFMYQKTAFTRYFNTVILIDTKKSLKNKNFRKKMSYLRKFPTSLVGKSKYHTKTKNSPKYIVVGNHENLKKFRAKILKILRIF